MWRAGTAIVAASVFALLLGGQGRAVSIPAPELRAVGAFLSEFETVFFTKGDLLANRYKQLPDGAAAGLEVPFTMLKYALRYAGPRASAALVGGSRAILVGTRDYRPPSGPSGLGSVQSNFCYGVILRRRNRFDPRGYLGSWVNANSKGGIAEWHWSAPPQEGHPRAYEFYMAEVQGQFVLVSNDPDELRVLVARISSPGAAGALKGNPSWVQVRNVEYWGYRRYRHRGVVDRDAAGLPNVTPSARSLVLMVDLDNKSALLQLNAADASAPNKINSAMMAMDPGIALPRLEHVTEGTWEARIPLTGPEVSGRMFVVLGLFGFEIYL